MGQGIVYLVGAGPGDPGLLTLRAKELLSKADAVVYDALIPSSLLNLIPENAEKIFRGHRTQKGALGQSRINSLLVKLAKQGKRVVRLKGGDPFVFGRGAEEALELQKRGIPFEVVPGVTSAIAVPAYAGIPVTHRTANSSFTVVTGHEDPTKGLAQTDWRGLAQNEGTLVFLMALHTLPSLCEKLIEAGKPAETAAALIQSGTTPGQRAVVGTLGTISTLARQAGLKPPTTLVVGKVVELAGKLSWFARKPLFGKRILVTRNREKGGALSQALGEKGAEVIEIPTMELRPLPLSAEGKRILGSLDSYEWIVFTSGNAVEIFIGYLFGQGMDVRSLGKAKVACVGEATAGALRAFGIRADLVAKDYKQEGLVQALQRTPLAGKKVLLPRAKEGREVLRDWLVQRKALVETWTLYENRTPSGAGDELRRLFKEVGGVDLLIFASSSSVENFYGIFSGDERRKWLRKVPVAAIGPVTAGTVRKWGGKVVVQPRKYTIPDLVTAIMKWAKHKGNRS